MRGLSVWPRLATSAPLATSVMTLHLARSGHLSTALAMTLQLARVDTRASRETQIVLPRKGGVTFRLRWTSKSKSGPLISFSLHRPSGPIQSLSRDVLKPSVFLCHRGKTRFPVDWRLLVEERIANIGITLDVFGFWLFQIFFILYIFLGFWFFANQPTVHNGGVSRGMVCCCGCWR